MKAKYIAIACAAFMMMGACSKDFRIDSVTANVESVEDGGTVVLDNGLTVHILGLAAENSFNEEYLKTNLIGHPISLYPDSQGDQVFYSMDDEIWAYADIDETGEPLTRKILTMAGKNGFDPSQVTDSLAAYTELVKKKIIPELDDNQLAAKLKSSSMLVFGQNASGSWIGTAFFINENGLAISNNHVVDHGADYRFYLSTSDGKLDLNNGYKLNRIVYTSNYKEGPDYTIFYVDLDNDSKKAINYLSVASTPLGDGEHVATVGNPAPGVELLPMRFSSGQISARDTDKMRYGINVPITHGFSGGPLINKYGEVVGISSSGYGEANLNFAVDFEVVRKKLDELNLPYAGK